MAQSPNSDVHYGEIAAKVVKACVEDKNARNAFMAATKDPASLKALLVNTYSVPDALAGQIADAKPKDLHAMVGQYICAYLW